MRLLENIDEFFWVWNITNVQITAKTSYEYISLVSSEAIGNWLSTKIGKWNMSLKLKCFLWLILRNKYLTWEILMKRSRIGNGMSLKSSFF